MKSGEQALWCAVAVFALSACGKSGPSRALPVAAGGDSARILAAIHTTETALPRIPDRAAALFLLAQGYAQLGDSRRALALLAACDSLDEGFDPSGVKAFHPLASTRELGALVDRVHRKHPPAQNARVAFTIPQADLFPEGLAYDSVRRVFYMGSMYRRKIIEITESGVVSDVVKSGQYHLNPVGGLKVDPADHSVWAASDSPELAHFDAEGRLLGRYSVADTGPHILNDLVLRGANELYVTDTDAGRVYRFDRASHTFTPLRFGRVILFPNGITLSPDGNLLYVADIFGVVIVDLRSGATEELNPGRGTTLAGIDGLYWYRRSLVGVQYGTGSHRVMQWRLSGDGRRVESATVLEYRTPLVSFPTTGAIVDNRFYYIANTGIGNLDHYRIIDSAKLEPVHVAVVPLGERERVRHPAAKGRHLVDMDASRGAVGFLFDPVMQ